MTRTRLSAGAVVAAGADLADERGIAAVTFAALATRLGVRAPALYKHVESVGDLHRRIAVLGMTEFGDRLQEALQGRSGRAAISATLGAVSGYIREHPGRYSATTGMPFGDDSDPFTIAATRVVRSLRAVLSSYGIDDADLDHAIRTLRCTVHGYAVLHAAQGFQWANDPDESIEWMVDFFDTGLRAVGGRSGPQSA